MVGIGGKNHYAVGTLRPNSQAHNDDTYGALKLTLNAAGYAWQFVSEAGRTYTDSGTASCN
jgi:hypothetical protein